MSLARQDAQLRTTNCVPERLTLCDRRRHIVRFRVGRSAVLDRPRSTPTTVSGERFLPLAHGAG
jgi:hypothetical protein